MCVSDMLLWCGVIRTDTTHRDSPAPRPVATLDSQRESLMTNATQNRQRSTRVRDDRDHLRMTRETARGTVTHERPSTFEARLEGTPTQSLNMKSAGSVRSRPQCHCRHPHDRRGHHGGFCITRTRRGVSTLPCGVGTSPTAASGATPGRQCGRVRRRAEGLRRWGPILYIHTRPTVAWGPPLGGVGSIIITLSYTQYSHPPFTPV